MRVITEASVDEQQRGFTVSGIPVIYYTREVILTEVLFFFTESYLGSVVSLPILNNYFQLLIKMRPI